MRQPDLHLEFDLYRSLRQHLIRFLTELERDSCLIGSEYPVQVWGGVQDIALDLLSFHRGLNCLVAIKLKVKHLNTLATRLSI